MRLYFTVAALVVALPIAAHAQPADAAVPQNSAAIGLIAAPTLDGLSPWLFAGGRLSVPVSPRWAIDFDGGRIFGGAGPFATFRGFGAVQFRRLRSPRNPNGGSTYFLYGIQYTPADKRTREGLTDRRHYTALVVGYGGDAQLGTRTRLSGEVGISGGEGVGCFVKLGVQWRLRPRQTH